MLDTRWLFSGQGTLRVLTFTSLGVGVAGLATWAGFGLAANATYEDLHARCGGPCPASERGAIATGRTLQTLTNVSLAAGLVGMAAGFTLVFVGPRVEGAPASTGGVRVGIAPAALTISGTF